MDSENMQNFKQYLKEDIGHFTVAQLIEELGWDEYGQFRKDLKNGRLLLKAKDVTSLEGCPKHLVSLDLSQNLFKSLEGGPELVTSIMDVSVGHLRSLDHAPKDCNIFTCSTNKLTSLAGIGRKYLTHCEELIIHNNDFEHSLMGIMLIDGLKRLKWATGGKLQDIQWMNAVDMIWDGIIKKVDFLDVQENMADIPELRQFAKL